MYTPFNVYGHPSHYMNMLERLRKMQINYSTMPNHFG